MSNTGTPPQSNEAEQAVLGAVLIKPEVMADVVTMVQVQDFHLDRHRIIYAAMCELFGEERPIDLLSVSQLINDQGRLEAIGGDSYLADLLTAVPSAANVEYYAEIVKDKAIRRSLIEKGQLIANLGMAPEGSAEQLLDAAEHELSEVGQAVGSSDFHELSDVLEEAMLRAERVSESDSHLRGVPTGFDNLDNKLSGFQKTDLIILAARPSVGKTALALDICRKAAVNHVLSIGFFSLEMGRDQLTDRMLAAEARVDAWRFRTGNLKDAGDKEAVKDARSRLAATRFFIDDNSYNNVLRIKSACRRLKHRKGLDLVVVDYLQLIAPLSKTNGNTVAEITEISRGLKQLAKELDVPVLALSQLSRNVEHRGENAHPRLADLRDSGSIEQDADVVIFIHRDKAEDGDGRAAETKLLIEKHRNGATGSVELMFDKKRSTFQEVDVQHQFDDFEGEAGSNEEFARL